MFCPSNCMCDLESSSLEIININALVANHQLSIVSLNDSVRIIDSGAFLCSDIVSLTGGYGLQSVGFGAFANCTKLQTVVFQDGLKSIGTGAFNNCRRLKELFIPSSVTETGYYRNYSTISKNATILCERDSYAEAYAKEHGYRIRLI